jgi:hypothetical protein
MSGIDFVIAWVDGTDEKWIAEKNKYSDKSKGSDPSKSDARYRDWDNLQYWFRSIEANAPWFDRIFFVTWGHVPAWLNTDHPKLRVVRHDEYIPAEYLPTFSSHTIELNLHRIKDLSDRFVYFNDDTYLNRRLQESDFFSKGLPCDTAALNVHCYALSRPIQMISVRDTGVINEHFEMKKCIRKNLNKWISPRYGKEMMRTLALIGAPRFPGFYISHAPQSYIKSSFDEVWRAEPDVLSETCSHRFREITDVNQWVIKEWQLASGRFTPRAASFSKAYFLGNVNRREIAEKAASDIINQKSRMICINDSEMPDEDYFFCKETVNSAFEKMYPEKSSFER